MKPFLIILFLTSSLFAQPWSPEVIWDRSGLQDSSLYGYEILPLGDQNDDGFNDWAVAAGGIRVTSGNQLPYVEFFHGGNPPSGIPYMTILGLTHLASWGIAGILNDVNGDGYVDWFTRRQSDSTGYDIVEIFWGGNAADTIPEYRLSILAADFFGTVGDFNGDEQSDLFWYHYISDYIDIFYGDDIIDWTADWSQSCPWGSFKESGDLNDDGYDDWVGATLSMWNTYIFLGGANPDTVPAYIWPSMLYRPLSIVNDLNGDRYCELVYSNCNIHYGAPQMSSIPSIHMSFPCGGIVDVAASLGDINHDGYNDLALIHGTCYEYSWGIMSLYLGQSTLNSEPAWRIPGRDWQNLNIIETAAGLGDVNGDGIDDFAIGAYDVHNQEGWRGRCIVVAGDSALRVDTDEPFIPHPSSFALSSFPNPFNPTATLSFTLPHSAQVSASVYNILGQIVYEENLGLLNAGKHQQLFDASELPSGVYLARVQAGEQSQIKKMVLLK